MTNFNKLIRLRYFLFAILGSILCLGNNVNAQLVTDDVFLQGKYLEVCVSPNGAWGNTLAPPAGYHTNTGGSTYSYPDPILGTYGGTATMDFQYDANHDGWGVAAAGSVIFYGPYFLPGTPFDGWSVQVNGVREDAFYNNGSTTFGFTGTLTGTNVSYSNSGGIARGVWQGTAAGGALSITETNRVDTLSSWDVVTIVFKNTTAAVLNGVYYLATADPDNDEVTTGGSFPTNNIVKFQNDFRHRVMVEARPPSIHQDAYSSLCTRDCRAKAFIYQSWPPFLGVGNTLDLMYAGTATGIGTATYAINTMTYDQDIAYGLIYNLGNIAAGDSTVISFAWNFKDSTCTDSAFPDPVLVIPGATGNGVRDTFNACAIPGLTSFTPTIANGTDKIWTWTNWTWSPSTGLSSTTGINPTINLTVIPGIITYTITGNDSTSGMHSCNNAVLYLTVITCNSIWATVNYPCQGDSLLLVCHSDSTGSIGATYSWTQIGGSFTSTLQNPFIYPASMLDTGTFRVIRTNASGSDTATVHVLIHPKPVFTLSCNGDSLCSGATSLDTMKLYSVPYIAGETFSWTGPNSFTSTLEFPTISPYLPIDTGWYHVRVTDIYGCWDTGNVLARIIPPIIPPTITGIHHYCTGDPFVPFGINLMPGATALWYTTATGGVGTPTASTVSTAYAHTVTVYASQIEGICEGLRDSFTVVVDTTPPAPVLTNSSPICSDSSLYFTATDGLTGVAMTYNWSGPAGFSSTLQNPSISSAISGVNNGTYVVTVTIPATGCHSSATTIVTIKPTPTAPAVSADSPCNGFTLHLNGSSTVGSTYLWNCPNGSSLSGSSPVISPAVLGTNDGTYTVTATLDGCPSLPSTITVKIFPNPLPPIVHDTEYCQYTSSIPLRADSLVDSSTGNMNTITWYTTPTGFSTVIEPYYPSTLQPGTFQWYATQTSWHGIGAAIYGCVSPRSVVNIHILDKPVFGIRPGNSFVCQDSVLALNYQDSGVVYVGTQYAWTLPAGTIITHGGLTQPSVSAMFDSVYHDTVSLLVTDNNWGISCSTKKSLPIKVVPQPWAHCYGNPIVCAGDTVRLEMTDWSTNAYSYIWDYAMSSNDSIIAGSSGTAGPFDVRWDDWGTKIIKLIAVTQEGCESKMTYDTIHVRQLPDAEFNNGLNGKACSDDSVLFSCDGGDHDGYSYEWTPEHFFKNRNSYSCWGRVEISGDVTLTVKDEFGCIGIASHWYDAEPCCIVSFPTAFTPNGNGENDIFRPIHVNYHRYHIFRIQNRWGQTVYESTNSDASWDGKYNGVPQDMGVYYYYLKFDCNGKTIEKKGDVTLIR